MPLRSVPAIVKWGASALALIGASAFSYDSFMRVPAAQAEAASVLSPVAVAAGHCSGMGFMRALPMFAMAKLPWVGKKPAATPAGADVPLWPGTGTYSHKITTSKPEAQAYFDQGLRLAYGFNRYEAIRSFRKAQAIDPKCAMCFWGEAYSFGPDINLPMLDDAVAPAFAAISKAVALAPKASPLERAMIAAMAKRYAEHPPADRAPLDQAFSNAMKDVVAQFPNDADAKVVYAEAMMDLSPWDYWEKGGTVPHAKQKDLEPALLDALKLEPNHPGALHYYIHAVEATPHPERAEAIADRLEPLMPSAGHMVHMPAHIYARVGRFEDSVKVNEAAVTADETYLKAVPARPPIDIYGIGYYPHNVHFVMISAFYAGDLQTMRDQAMKLPGLIPDQLLVPLPPTQPIKVAAMLDLAHTGFDKEVLALPKPSDDVPFVQAMWHYARGICLARAGNITDAQAELKAIENLSSSGALFKLPQTVVPSEILGEIATNVLKARILEAKGDMKGAIAALREADEDQAQVPYTEPAFWYYPVKQSLGGLLLASGKPKEAIDVFRASLLDQPGNAWALYGLMKAYEKTGDKAAAAETKKQFEAAWLGGEPNIDIKQL